MVRVSLCIAVLMSAACSNENRNEADDRESYEWLKKTAEELRDDERLLSAIGRALGNAEAFKDVVDYDILVSQYPKWILRHNQKVRMYNERSREFDRSPFRARTDMPRIRFWELNDSSDVLKYNRPQTSDFHSKEEKWKKTKH